MQLRAMVPPKGQQERFLTKNARNLVEVTFCNSAGSYQVFLRGLKGPTGQALPPPLQKLAVAEHADGAWICLPLRHTVINLEAALAEARLFAKQHLDS